jgi:hypothetical protein
MRGTNSHLPCLIALAAVLCAGPALAAKKKHVPPPEPPPANLVEEDPDLDKAEIKHIKSLATTGYIFSLAGVGLMVASWISYFPDVGKKGGDLSPAWIGLMSSWGAVSAVGIPLLLAANYKGRRALGKPPVGGYFIAGWFFLGVGYAALAFIDAQPVYTMLYATIGYVASMTWSWAAAGRSINRIRNIEKRHKEKTPFIMPYVTGMPGGAMAGVTGAF